MIHISIPGTPVAQGNHRATRQGRIYETTKGHREWRDAVRFAALACAGAEPLAGPVSVSMAFTFARPDSHLRKDGQLRKGKPDAKISRPDLSKLVRCAEDALTDAGVWQDDSQITALIASKVYGPIPGLIISVVPLKPKRQV